MFQIDIKNWFLFVLVFIAGAIIAVMVWGKIKNLVKRFLNKASLIKEYWMFIAPFVLAGIGLYYIVLNYSPEQKLNVYIVVLGQALTLIFAIFVGYFAFLQVVENRLDKLKGEAFEQLTDKSYVRAIQSYEKAHAIDPKDISILGNLAELYLILKDYRSFDEKLAYLESLAIEEKEKLQCYYLKTAKFLLRQHLHEAKEELKRFVQFTKDHPISLTRFRWSFEDIEGSEVYEKLNGEAKTIFENFIKYMKRGLPTDQKELFESGNYLLVIQDTQS